MERIESQRKQIKDWLEKGRPITPIMALQMFGCFRLAAQIFVLKNEYDMPIKTEIVVNASGKRYAKYYLEKNEN